MILTPAMAEAFWTQADIDKLRKAVVSGALTVMYDGPPKRSVTYQSLADMRSLLAEMRRDVNGSPTFRLGATNTGLNGSRGNDGSGE